MTILWCGGEDMDGCPLPASIGSYGTNGFDRGKIYNLIARNIFARKTSVWISFQFFVWNSGVNLILCGLTDSNTISSGIYLGISEAYAKACILKYDGTSRTILNSESGASLLYNSTHKIDINIINYGIYSTINLYIDGNLAVTFSGDSTIPNVTSFNSINAYGSATNHEYSEIIVADEDTRLMRLKTLAPDSAGDTNSWTGAYTDIDETTLSDADKIYSATNNADFQTNLTGMPSGTWSVKAVKVAARCVDGSGSTGIQLGVKSGGTVNVGDTQTASGYWQTKERLMQVNPVTGVAWTPAEIEALQINLRAKTL